MSTSTLTPVLAAGAVCWRYDRGKLRILLVHRAERNDVSLPKGKVDPGETMPETAVREIREETGLDVALGAPLGQVEYTIPSGREKVVYYWTAEVHRREVEASMFIPNDEIAELEWVSLKRAREILTYPHDVEIVDVFAERVGAGQARTFAVIVVRHGKAMPPNSWDGPDATRPLVARGTAQAASIARGIAAYRPQKIVSSTAIRCLATIAPLARLTGIDVIESSAISEDAQEAGDADVWAVVSKRLKKEKTVVLCSHSPVIPEIISAIADLTGTAQTTEYLSLGSLGTGEFSVLHIARDNADAGLVALETHAPASD